MIKGYDVSVFQDANFPTAGISFVFIKGIEGNSYVNLSRRSRPRTPAPRDSSSASRMPLGISQAASLPCSHFLKTPPHLLRAFQNQRSWLCRRQGRDCTRGEHGVIASIDMSKLEVSWRSRRKSLKPNA